MAESGSIAKAFTASGWQADLHLGFAVRGNRTVLAHRHHFGPLLVQRPFYPEAEVCHVYVVHPPGGVVGGDRLGIRIEAAPGSHALLTTPAAGKFYRSNGAEARQQVDFTMNGASCEWLPQETIFYRDAIARVRTRVHLDAGSRLFAWEIGCFGLAARGEDFSGGRVMQGFEVWLGERPLLCDRLRLDGSSGMMQAAWGLAGRSVLGTLLAYPAGKDELEAARAAIGNLADTHPIGVTLVDGLLICRCLHEHADAVMRRFVAMWVQLRPGLFGRPAVAPRIWAT